MGYDIELVDKMGNPCIVETHEECGGYIVVGGTDFAEISITYNYAGFYYTHFDEVDGIRWIYGKNGKQCEERLEKSVKKLGVNRSADYWKSTPGNAGYVLSVLLKWAKQYPDGKFVGD